jgi:hypothetical protein
MKKTFKIAYINPEKEDYEYVVKTFEDWVEDGEVKITAEEWAEDLGYTLADKGWYEVELLRTK